jgi:general secretion pathway protein C
MPITRLPVFMPRAAAFACFAVLCATATYWGVTLSGERHVGADAVLAEPGTASVEQAGLLFGNGVRVNRDLRLLGVLELGHAAAAIVSLGDETPHAVGLNGELGNGAKLVEVHARSIVVERQGVRSEVFLSDAPGTSIFLR